MTISLFTTGARAKAEGAVPLQGAAVLLQGADVQHVGEPDGQSFGIGVTPSSVRAHHPASSRPSMDKHPRANVLRC